MKLVLESLKLHPGAATRPHQAERIDEGVALKDGNLIPHTETPCCYRQLCKAQRQLEKKNAVLAKWKTAFKEVERLLLKERIMVADLRVKLAAVAAASASHAPLESQQLQSKAGEEPMKCTVPVAGIEGTDVQPEVPCAAAAVTYDEAKEPKPIARKVQQHARTE